MKPGPNLGALKIQTCNRRYATDHSVKLNGCLNL